jgi:cell division protein FtsL
MKASVLPTVVEGARRRRAGTGVGCLVLFGLTLAALGHVALHTKHIESSLAMGKASRRHKELLERNRQLQLENVRLKDPNRIVEVARDKLGMGKPTEIVPVAAVKDWFERQAAEAAATKKPGKKETAP